ncbi:oxidative stress-responsive serine-rich protein 1-like isoform X1 [Phasianus colchicus]|uniref:oxidative stress-responsive serine-rich protein 1-like isoform X1 n=1 Tax=Phasianus colchicus TaxID=9054 RepID=UPI00129EEF75|nr:oxidative stress-responsive serine-rich protein 1-like isoform X1 [Phasianus colchicus]
MAANIPFTGPFVANRRQEQQQQQQDEEEAEEEQSLRTAFKKLRVDEARRWIAAQPVGDGTVLTAPRRRAADGARQPSVCCQEARNG